MRKSRFNLAYEKRVTSLALVGGLPAVLASMFFLWTGEYNARMQWTLSALILGVWVACLFATHERIVFPLRTISNLLAALREGDFSLRARTLEGDALSEVMAEINQLGSMLREQRLSAVEATHLLSKVMEEINVAVFAFDADQVLRLVNRAGATLLAQPAERLVGQEAAELGLLEYLEREGPLAVQRTFPGGVGRWGVGVSVFREHGVPHRLLVLSDLTRELREEELQAWQRLVRVLGHELNNSLAPIKSIAGSLATLLAQMGLPADRKQDIEQGLTVIGSRAEALSRFTGAYARLAKLPPANPKPVSVSAWVRRVAELETRKPIRISSGPEVTVEADPDQLEQLLINLLGNAVEATSETGGAVEVGWRRNHSSLEVWVRDEGPGISDEANLFVPFFTTKPGGSGIGLVLCRKIAENHGGTLTLENRSDARGCEARLTIPLGRPSS